MSTSFQYEDPLNRANVQISTMQQTKLAMRDMGSKMVSTGKGFGKVGAVYSGIECCVEGVRPRLFLAFSLPLLRAKKEADADQGMRDQYRAKNDIYNAVGAGLLAGGILAMQSGGGPKAALGGGAAFAAFSAAIDLYMRKEPA